MTLEVRGLAKSFHPPGAGIIEVLKQVEFYLAPGQTTAVIGQSGSGKTTLLSLLAGLDTPDRGRVVLEGKNISAMDEDRLTRFRARKIGVVFQQFHLMPHLTARENISLPLEILKLDKDSPGGILARTDELLEKVALTNRQHHLPGQLSGGECQRVAIARALVIRPALILADEPTGNLDTGTGKKVANLLFDLVDQEKKCLVLVTHNPELARRCQQVRQLDKGVLS